MKATLSKKLTAGKQWRYYFERSIFCDGRVFIWNYWKKKFLMFPFQIKLLYFTIFNSCLLAEKYILELCSFYHCCFIVMQKWCNGSAVVDNKCICLRNFHMDILVVDNITATTRQSFSFPFIFLNLWLPLSALSISANSNDFNNSHLYSTLQA